MRNWWRVDKIQRQEFHTLTPKLLHTAVIWVLSLEKCALMLPPGLVFLFFFWCSVFTRWSQCKYFIYLFVAVSVIYMSKEHSINPKPMIFKCFIHYTYKIYSLTVKDEVFIARVTYRIKPWTQQFVVDVIWCYQAVWRGFVLSQQQQDPHLLLHPCYLSSLWFLFDPDPFHIL